MSDEWLFIGESAEFRSTPRVVRLREKPVVLVRKEGRLLAFLDRCPHRGFSFAGAQVGGGSTLRCSYHGWSFGDQGELLDRPGIEEGQKPPACLPAFRTHESGGFAFVNFAKLDANARPPSWVESLDEPMHKLAFVRTIRAMPLDVLENVLDPFHTTYIHGALLRPNPRRVLVDVLASYDSGEKVLTMEYFNEPAPGGWVSRLFEDERARTLGRFHHPNAAVLEYWTRKGFTMRVTLMTTELEGGYTRGAIVFQFARRGIPFFLKRPVLRWFGNVLVRQDFNALEALAENQARFPGASPWIGKEDIVMRTMLALKNGETPCSFQERYQVRL